MPHHISDTIIHDGGMCSN